MGKSVAEAPVRCPAVVVWSPVTVCAATWARIDSIVVGVPRPVALEKYVVMVLVRSAAVLGLQIVRGPVVTSRQI